MAKCDKLIDGVNAVQQGSQDARKGLRGMSILNVESGKQDAVDEIINKKKPEKSGQKKK